LLSLPFVFWSTYIQGFKDAGRAVDSGGLTTSGQISREESSVCRKNKQSFSCMLFLETGEIVVPPGDTSDLEIGSVVILSRDLMLSNVVLLFV
jgi:hypothetical protein